MSKITPEEVRKVGQLARIRLTNEEVERFGSQLTELITYMEQISEVDVSGVSPTAQTAGQLNVYDQDEVQLGLSPDEALSQAPHAENQQFKVIKVFVRE